METPDYSANKLLEKFSKKIRFNLDIFDDGKIFRLKNKTTGGEIDALLYYKNIVILVDVYDGNKEAQSKLADFERKQHNLSNIDQALSNFEIKPNGPSGKDKIKVDKILKNFQIYVKGFKKSHKIIFKKLIFYPSVDVNEKCKEKYFKKGLFIIDKEIITYLDKVYEILGMDYLFREIMSFFEISKTNLDQTNPSSSGLPGQLQPLSVSRLVLENGKIIMYSCPCPVSLLEEHTTVFRPISKKYDVEGFQRMLKEDRINKISKEYLKNNETFPNSIIIGLDPKFYKSEKDFFVKSKLHIKLYNEYNSLLIIDGQHRFFSLLKTSDSNCRKVLVTFVFFKGRPKQTTLKMCKIFYEINKTQERIDPSLSFVLRARIYPESEDAFWFDVLKKLNDSSGFFKNRVSFKEKNLRYKDEKSIISVVTYGGLLTLNKKVKKIDGLKYFYGKNILKSKKFASNLLKNFFSLIQEHLLACGKQKDDLTPREIGAFIRLIRHFMIKDAGKVKTLGSFVDIRNIKGKRKVDVEYFKKIISYIDFNEIFSSSLSASNWAGVEGLILKQIHKGDKGFGDKTLLSKKGLAFYA